MAGMGLASCPLYHSRCSSAPLHGQQSSWRTAARPLFTCLTAVPCGRICPIWFVHPAFCRLQPLPRVGGSRARPNQRSPPWPRAQQEQAGKVRVAPYDSTSSQAGTWTQRHDDCYMMHSEAWNTTAAGRTRFLNQTRAHNEQRLSVPVHARGPARLTIPSRDDACLRSRPWTCQESRP